jgi:hypothetical protein
VQIHVPYKQTLRNVSDPSTLSNVPILIAVFRMLNVIGATPGAVAQCNYARAWSESPEFRAAKAELQHMGEVRKPLTHKSSDNDAHHEYAAPFSMQLYYVTYRFDGTKCWGVSICDILTKTLIKQRLLIADIVMSEYQWLG